MHEQSFFTFRKLAFAMSNMKGIYSKAQVILKSGRRLAAGESGIVEYFRKTSDYDLLAEAWQKWRQVTGDKCKEDYIKMVHLLNKGARENGTHR